MKEYSIALVVDRAFGERLVELASRLHVWVCSSAENDRAAEVIRAANSKYSPDSGVTVLTARDEEQAEELIIGALLDVDLHHGTDSHPPAWTTLEVFGSAPTPEVEEALHRYGVTRIERTESGFMARRPSANETRDSD